MLRLILPLSLVLVLSSCYSYQYVTLQSPDVPVDTSRGFTFENDTLRLVYNFHGQGGPMGVTIYNKTTTPLYVVWNKSALLRDGHSTSLFNPNVQVNGTVNSSVFLTKNIGYSSGALSASFTLPEGMDFIAPRSDIHKTLIPVQYPSDLLVLDLSGIHVEKGTDEYGYTMKMRRKTFAEQESPLRFSSYITFVSGNNPGTEFALQHNFYAAELVQTGDGPEAYSAYGNDANKLYVRQSQ